MIAAQPIIHGDDDLLQVTPVSAGLFQPALLSASGRPHILQSLKENVQIPGVVGRTPDPLELPLNPVQAAARHQILIQR